MHLININNWGLGIDIQQSPLLIAGPCSAETREQLIETCLQIARYKRAQLLRAGVWKPRTRPNSFEGMGAEALSWLQEAKQVTGLPVCIEVASAQHVELALKHGVDVLWIGARTTVNPFSVQDIADALRGVDVPVMVKNPVNPDLELWIGAMERLYAAGIRKMAAIHRGFSVYKTSRYRNNPQWEIPIELRRRFPQLEIICDPSHIAGKREYLYEIAQQAFDLNFDGLMMEVHRCPDQAWSDAQQQLTPQQWVDMLDSLVQRQVFTANPLVEQQLAEMRGQIDQLDNEIFNLLAERMRVARQIGGFKKNHNIAILQMERWMEIFRSRTAKADSLNIATAFVEELLAAVHKESIRQQAVVMQEKKNEELQIEELRR